MIRMNITMPEELAQELSDVSNKSRYIAQALREKLDRERKAQLECLLIEGYKESADEDRKVNGEWEKDALEDGWQ